QSPGLSMESVCEQYQELLEDHCDADEGQLEAVIEQGFYNVIESGLNVASGAAPPNINDERRDIVRHHIGDTLGEVAKVASGAILAAFIIRGFGRFGNK